MEPRFLPGDGGSRLGTSVDPRIRTFLEHVSVFRPLPSTRVTALVQSTPTGDEAPVPNFTGEGHDIIRYVKSRRLPTAAKKAPRGDHSVGTHPKIPALTRRYPGHPRYSETSFRDPSVLQEI